ncbi:tol-pal system protein YbgF [Desulfonatronum thiosulfatophilum]|uniref:Tol-pal system protein YbgF n=1 Tax=Desulfonatronum thiosulfatophilum TaxID=617002 RepID=A0A1G6DYI1_9BACT|nr:tol-pal system protein YbgF [Desulfonatronum thiosulfatophilum]SDB49805.1 tol-pal system protein YbgF [Desulfonatronum thiosulfatophilum]
MKPMFMRIGIFLWLSGLGLSGCASSPSQQGRMGNLEYALVEMRDRQDRQAAEFRERLESMEMSLLQQERFLQDFLGEGRPDSMPRHVGDGERARDPDVEPSSSGDKDALVAPKTPPALIPPPVSKTGTEPAPKPDAGSREEAKALYDQALAKYFDARYARARADFFAFQERFPNHPLLPNALYWHAETLYAQKQFAQSIFVFKELSRRFPKHAKAPDALLKAGYAYEQLEDIPNARFHLQIVLEDYPNAPAAALARERLSRMPAFMP